MTGFARIYYQTRKRENALNEHSAWCDSPDCYRADDAERIALRDLINALRYVPQSRRQLFA